MRIRLFTEIEIADSAIVKMQETVTAKLTQPMEIEVSGAMARQVEKLLKTMNGVTEVRSVYIPNMIGL